MKGHYQKSLETFIIEVYHSSRRIIMPDREKYSYKRRLDNQNDLHDFANLYPQKLRIYVGMDPKDTGSG